MRNIEDIKAAIEINREILTREDITQDVFNEVMAETEAYEWVLNEPQIDVEVQND